MGWTRGVAGSGCIAWRAWNCAEVRTLKCEPQCVNPEVESNTATTRGAGQTPRPPVLCEVIGVPIKRLAQLIGEPIKLTGKRALLKALQPPNHQCNKHTDPSAPTVFPLSLHLDRLPGQFCRLLERLAGLYIEHWAPRCHGLCGEAKLQEGPRKDLRAQSVADAIREPMFWGFRVRWL